ncbi:hypothetical protein OH76DRAFT_1418376 [Lentinus brumalis]|uniref:Uncharacterized protein n=1 Tax=Lentinus brumalis TaxID=2498619 RepID=A0A371DAT9_9APHY|nr:hypothetical protein OH76DRAFT_1418376 [Polyporus brumalis]
MGDARAVTRAVKAGLSAGPEHDTEQESKGESDQESAATRIPRLSLPLAATRFGHLAGGRRQDGSLRLDVRRDTSARHLRPVRHRYWPLTLKFQFTPTQSSLAHYLGHVPGKHPPRPHLLTLRPRVHASPTAVRRRSGHSFTPVHARYRGTYRRLGRTRLAPDVCAVRFNSTGASPAFHDSNLPDSVMTQPSAQSFRPGSGERNALRGPQPWRREGTEAAAKAAVLSWRTEAGRNMVHAVRNHEQATRCRRSMRLSLGTRTRSVTHAQCVPFEEHAYLLLVLLHFSTGLPDAVGAAATTRTRTSPVGAMDKRSAYRDQRDELRTWEISATRQAASHQERVGTCCAVDSACARVPGLCGTAELEARRMAEREMWTYSMTDGLSGELAASGTRKEGSGDVESQESRGKTSKMQDAVVSRTLELLYTPTSGQPPTGSRVRRAAAGTRESQTASGTPGGGRRTCNG